MLVSFSCVCGRSACVTEEMAGTTIYCIACLRPLALPPLERLRELPPFGSQPQDGKPLPKTNLEGEWDFLFTRWWGLFLMAGLFTLCAWLVHHSITSVEEKGENARVNWFVAIAYYLGGKTCAVLAFGLPALVCALIGLVKITAKLFSSGKGK